MTAWLQTRAPETNRCPICDFHADAMSSPEGKRPQPGDLSVCLNCTAPLLIGEGLTIRALTLSEIEALPDRLRGKLRLFQTAIRRSHANA